MIVYARPEVYRPAMYTGHLSLPACCAWRVPAPASRQALCLLDIRELRWYKGSVIMLPLHRYVHVCIMYRTPSLHNCTAMC